MTVDFIPGELRGYRAWQVAYRDDMRIGRQTLGLQAMAAGTIWSVNMKATCQSRGAVTRHRTPAKSCTCGFYGWYTPEGLESYAAGPIIGCIAATGRVVLGTHGFRAEHARVVAVAPGLGTVADALPVRVMRSCLDQGVDVLENARQLFERYPPNDVTELIGPQASGKTPSVPESFRPAQPYRPFCACNRCEVKRQRRWGLVNYR